MDSQKLCESAYMAATHPRTGPYLHGAAMVDRTSGTTHVYLVRGECSESVVAEIEKQLVKAGRLKRKREHGFVTSVTAAAICLIGLGLASIFR